MTNGDVRAVQIVDVDGDGDLDIIIYNLTTPVQILENQLCDGNSLELDLFWTNSDNTRALDATVTLVTNDGFLTRQIKAGSGYLSGDPARIHFGIPDQVQLDHVQINWPDGLLATIDNITANT